MPKYLNNYFNSLLKIIKWYKMARIRTIKPKFWDDLKLSKISRESRLTFIAFWNFADDNGVILAENGWLKSKIYPHDDIKLKKFSSWVQEMLKVELIIPIIFNRAEYYYLPNFQKHQIINRPNVEDVFIPTESLNEMLLNSLNGHGLITDNSVPYRKGEERKGKEGIGGEAPGAHTKKNLGGACLFRESEFFDFEKFCNAFKNSKYEIFNLEVYYESVLNWSDSKQARKLDWLATARNFMLGDAKKGTQILANQKFIRDVKGNSTNQYADLESRLAATINGTEDK